MTRHKWILLGLALMLTSPAYALDEKAGEQLRAETEEEYTELRERIEAFDEEISARDTDVPEGWRENFQALKGDLEQHWNEFTNATGEAVEGVKAGTESAVDKLQNEYVELKRNYYQWRIENRIEDINEEKEELMEAMATDSEDGQDDVQAAIQTLEEKQAVAKTKLQNLKENNYDTWEEFESGMDQALEDMENAWENVEDKIS